MHRSSMLIAVVTAAALLIVAGFFSVLAGQSKESLPSTLRSGGKMEALQWGDPDTDLDSCQQDCRSKYNIDFFTLQSRGGGSGSHSPGYYLYAQCIADCNRAFWNRFDRQMDRLQKE